VTVQIGMLCDRIRPDERMVIEAAKKKNIELIVHNVDEIVFDTFTNSETKFENVILQRVMSYFKSMHITALLEKADTKVVNSFNAAMICGNKLLTSITLSKAGVPTPKTFVAFTEESSLKALEKVGYPAILKPVVGSWGRLIAPLKDLDSARAILETREFMYPLYQVFYIQEMMQNLIRDIRCFVIGEHAVGAMYRYSAPGEWRANIAKGGRAEACPITSEIEELAVKAAKAVGGAAVGVDMMESPNGLVVHEVNYTTEFKALTESTGIDIPGLILDFLVDMEKH
jgi:[lysine-biosynthesis-protein LysW]---L-2-aminoadipate ligase